MWTKLFGKGRKTTTGWVLNSLFMGKIYKDLLTCFRLALIFLVEVILCPTCGQSNLRSEVVEIMADIDAFFKYPWGCQSFLLAVNSTKGRYVFQLAHDSTAIQGFAHAMVLVILSCCPEIILKRACTTISWTNNLTVEEIVERVVERSLTVNVVNATTIDKKGQVQEQTKFILVCFYAYIGCCYGEFSRGSEYMILEYICHFLGTRDAINIPQNINN